MKLILLVLVAVSATVLALPAGKSSNDPQLAIVPLEKGPYGNQPIIDTGVINAESAEIGLFEDLFRNLAGVMSRMQQQIDSLFGRNRNGTIENVDFPGLFVPNIDLSKGNTTSVTKKIDGHKVVINQTVYNGDDDGTFFNVRVVEVLPDSSEEKTAPSATSEPHVNNEKRDRESVEDSGENEVKSRENNEAGITMNFDNIETFDDIDAPLSSPSSSSKWKEFESLENFNEIDDNSIDTLPAIDLSRDTYVNDIMADAGVAPNPDAEIFDPELLQSAPSRPVRWRQQHQFEKLVRPR